VSQLARRYDVNANLVLTWRRDPRFSDADCAGDSAWFPSVEITAPVDPAAEISCSENVIEIDLAAGIGCGSPAISTRRPWYRTSTGFW